MEGDFNERLPDALKLPDLPTAPQFKVWRQDVRVQTAALTQKGSDEVFVWMKAVDDTTREQCDNPGRYKGIDAKL